MEKINLMKQIKFNYLYRDGSNFKKWSHIVFSNPDGVTLKVVRKVFRDTFGGDGLFIAHQVRVPEVFLYGKGDANADDHCFHEFNDVSMSSEIPNDMYGRSINQFIAEVQRIANLGWVPFDPFDRWLRRSSSF
jgi:hypothetical protein